MQIKIEELDEYLKDKTHIIGCDEAGTGALFSSFFVCGVLSPKDWKLEGLNDSKKLSSKRREIMREKLLKLSENGEIKFYLAERTSSQIDEFGLAYVLKDAYIEIIKNLYSPTQNSLIICDGTLKFDIFGVDNIVSLIQADGSVAAVMAASILAKTTRDNSIKELHKLFPQYGFDKHMGYGTKEHMAAIQKYGKTSMHRMSYNLKFLNK